MNAPSVPNYLVASILVTIFCCLPLGIPAIVFASQANSKQAAGDIAGAMASAKQAKLFTWLGFGLGLAGMVLYFGFMIVGIIAAGAAESY